MLASEREFVDRCGELLELLAVVTIVGIVIALSRPVQVAEHVRIVEALDLLLGARVDLHDHLAVTGSWPAADQITLSGLNQDHEEEFMRPHYVASLKPASDGALLVSMHQAATGGPGRQLSLRPATMSGQVGSPIVWLCGYADAPAGFVAVARNETDIDSSRLPSPCRASLTRPSQATP